MHGLSIFDPSVVLIGSLLLFSNFGFIYIALEYRKINKVISVLVLISSVYIDLLSLLAIWHVANNR